MRRRLMLPSAGTSSLQIGSRAFVRAGGGTRIALKTLDEGFSQYDISGGDARPFRPEAPAGRHADRGRAHTPAAAFHDRSARLLPHRRRRQRHGVQRAPRRYGSTWSRRTARRPTSPTASASSSPIPPAADIQAAPTPTTGTVGTRTGRRNSRKRRRVRYVSPAVAGVDDLDRYGDGWRAAIRPRLGPAGRRVGLGPARDGALGIRPVLRVDMGGRCAVAGRRTTTAAGSLSADIGVGLRARSSCNRHMPALVGFFGAGHRCGPSEHPFVRVALGFRAGHSVVGRRWLRRPHPCTGGGWGGPRYVEQHPRPQHRHRPSTAGASNRFANMDARNAIVGIDRAAAFGRADRPFRMGDRASAIRRVLPAAHSRQPRRPARSGELHAASRSGNSSTAEVPIRADGGDARAARSSIQHPARQRGVQVA